MVCQNFFENWNKQAELSSQPLPRERIRQATAFRVHGLKTDVETIMSEDVVICSQVVFQFLATKVIVQFFVASHLVHGSFCEVEVPPDPIVGSKDSFLDPPDLLPETHGEEILQ